MSYTTVYRFQDLNGYESVISKANSDMTYEGFGRILLNPGQTLEYKVTGEEQAIVLQQGDMTCWVEYEGVTVVDGAKGQRGNVYDDLPTALYVPPKATVKLYSEKGMPIIILGGIYTGIFTPTESAAVACAYGLIVGCFIYREINFKGLVETVKSAAASSGMIMFIVACAGVFGLLMTREQIPAHAAEFIMSICSNKVVFLLLVNVLLLIVGCFMDTTPAILIIAPILFPALSAYNIDPVHFGIIMLLNMCIGMITPPLGINLYVAATLRQAKVGELVNRHLLKYMICCLVNLLLITYIPQICLWLPSFME